MNRYVDSFIINNNEYFFMNLNKVILDYPVLKKMPNSLKLLLEQQLRHTSNENIDELINIFIKKDSFKSLEFYANRMILEDNIGYFTLLDLITLKEIVKEESIDKSFDFKILVDLIIDQSLIIKDTSTFKSLDINMQSELQYNKSKYQFLKYCEKNIEKLTLIPPFLASANQINLEFLSTLINANTNIDSKIFLYPESLLGENENIAMANALGIVSFKTEYLNTHELILGKAVRYTLPKVVGIQLTSNMPDNVNIFDLLLNLIGFLKQYDLSGKIIEFFGDVISSFSLEDRAVLTSIVKHTKAIFVHFNVDENTINYIEKSRGVDATLIKEYFKVQGLFGKNSDKNFDEVIKFDLSKTNLVIVESKKINEAIFVKKVPSKIPSFKIGNILKDNDIVLASLTSGISSSNPFLIIQAALLAKKAVLFGLQINTNIKKIFIPGSIIIRDYLQKFDLLRYFEELGFYITAYGCGVCCKNQLELSSVLENEINKFNLNVCSVSTCNMDFNQKINPLVSSNWIMSPSLVLAYSLKGNINCNILEDEISKGYYLKDLYPSFDEVMQFVSKIDTNIFLEAYKTVFIGGKYWQEILENRDVFLEENKRYFKNDFSKKIVNAKILAIFEKEFASDEFLKIENKNDDFYCKDFINDEIIPMIDFINIAKKENSSLVIFSKYSFSSSSLDDFVAKKLKFYNVKVVVARKFPKGFKKSLIKFGILPLQWIDEEDFINSLNGEELININLESISINSKIELEVIKDGNIKNIFLLSKIENQEELNYFKCGGLLPSLLK